MKIVFLDAATLGDASLSPIAELGELICYPTSTPEEALARVSDCEVLIVNKIVVGETLLARAPKLQLVCVAATGVNNIDFEATGRRGIVVRNVAGYSTDSVAQLAWMQILSIAGNGQAFDDCVKSGAYSKMPVFTDPNRSYWELTGKTLGIIGLGAIGSKVAQIGEAFGMKVVYYSTSLTHHSARYPSVSLGDLLTRSDVVSIHAPYNERTAGLVGEKELRLMKPQAILVNMGRGGIVDETALAKAIDEEWIGGAALDVFAREPVPSDSPLLHTAHPERFRFSPHVAWASCEARARLVDAIAENIRKGW